MDMNYKRVVQNRLLSELAEGREKLLHPAFSHIYWQSTIAIQSIFVICSGVKYNQTQLIDSRMEICVHSIDWGEALRTMQSLHWAL